MRTIPDIPIKFTRFPDDYVNDINGWAFDKETIPALTALIGCKYIKKEKIKFLPKAGLERWFIIILLIESIKYILYFPIGRILLNNNQVPS